MPADGETHRHENGTGLAGSRAELIEHAMRLVGDEMLVWPLRQAAPASTDMLGCLGRIAARAPGLLPAGSPLRVWATSGGRALDPGWRMSCPPRSGSLWGELVLLRALVGEDPGAGDPLLELTALRSRV